MNPRRVAFDVLRQVSAHDAYANLALAHRLDKAALEPRDAAFATELVYGTARGTGTYDQIIEAAAGRKLSTLQPAVIDLLRLGSHQLLGMQLAPHAAVASTVELARKTVGQRVTGLVNAVLRKVARQDLEQWTNALASSLDAMAATALKTMHPTWIAEAYAEVLPKAEVAEALRANNISPQTTLAVRPGLVTRDELVAAGAEPTQFSPYGATISGSPGRLPAVGEGRAGVQDEGSQLVALALAATDGPSGPWLDLCAGPGGKAALLHGLAEERGSWLLASELQEHRAGLVQQNLRGYQHAQVIVADGARPAWQQGSFAKVMADVPCSGLGSLRRRPESRWRRRASDIESLVGLQQGLLQHAIDSVAEQGVVAYVTCSPHRAETSAVVEAVLTGRDDVEVLRAADYLPQVPDCELGPYVQLWPHRHGTDAMFLALLRRKSGPQLS